jgi:predicted nucleic acid-binding protein
MIVFTDTGVLGLLSSPNDNLEAQQCQRWLYSLLARGVYVITSDLCDYEVRRSLILDAIRKPKQQALNNLDGLENLIDFLPITKPIMRHAAQLWAFSRSQGMPTADEKNIDADVIIAAQCQLFQQENLGQTLVIATTNVKHLKRFLDAQKWQDIRF